MCARWLLPSSRRDMSSSLFIFVLKDCILTKLVQDWDTLLLFRTENALCLDCVFISLDCAYFLGPLLSTISLVFLRTWIVLGGLQVCKQCSYVLPSFHKFNKSKRVWNQRLSVASSCVFVQVLSVLIMLLQPLYYAPIELDTFSLA